MVVLLDGGFSSQLKKHVGMDEKVLAEKPLWCAEFLVTNPGAVINAHSDYIEAGCEVISTNTYQASVDGFQKYLGFDREQSLELIKEAVNLARKAVQKSANGRSVMVAGSVGAYGACLHDGSEYRGEYIESTTQQQLMEWHRPRVAALAAAGVDLLAVETIPAVAEAEAVLSLLRAEFPTLKAWVSFTCKDDLHLSHGETFKYAVEQCCQTNRDQLVAVGVNCSNPVFISSLLRSVQGRPVPFIVYPNSGESWDADEGWTNKEACLPLVHYFPEWISLGAKYIGGCCRTTAEDIRLCREFLDQHTLKIE